MFYNLNFYIFELKFVYFKYLRLFNVSVIIIILVYKYIHNIFI